MVVVSGDVEVVEERRMVVVGERRLGREGESVKERMRLVEDRMRVVAMVVVPDRIFIVCVFAVDMCVGELFGG